MLIIGPYYQVTVYLWHISLSLGIVLPIQEGCDNDQIWDCMVIPRGYKDERFAKGFKITGEIFQ